MNECDDDDPTFKGNSNESNIVMYDVLDVLLFLDDDYSIIRIFVFCTHYIHELNEFVRQTRALSNQIAM